MKFLFIILFFLFIGCASNITTSKLTSGGFTSAERKTYIKHNGRMMNARIMKGFLKGKTCIGMKLEQLIMLYGSPSRIYAIEEPGITIRRKAWDYHDKTDTTEVIVLLSVVFNTRNHVIAINGEKDDKCLGL